MNTLRPSVFVGGPIQASTCPQRGFDPTVRSMIETTIRALESDGFSVFSAHLVEDFGASDRIYTPQDVTARDYAWVHEADVYVAILPVKDGKAVSSGGTHIELGWASAKDLPIFILWEETTPDAYSHLVRGLNRVASAVTYVDLLQAMHDPKALTSEINAVLARHPKACQEISAI